MWGIIGIQVMWVLSKERLTSSLALCRGMCSQGIILREGGQRVLGFLPALWLSPWSWRLPGCPKGLRGSFFMDGGHLRGRELGCGFSGAGGAQGQGCVWSLSHYLLC